MSILQKGFYTPFEAFSEALRRTEGIELELARYPSGSNSVKMSAQVGQHTLVKSLASHFGDLPKDEILAALEDFRGEIRAERKRQMPEIQTMDFSVALHHLKHGDRMARKGWNGKGMWVEIQRPDAHSKMSLPYFYIEYPEGHPAYPRGSRVPWLASQSDLLAEDWAIVVKE